MGDHEAWCVKVCGSICIHVFIKMWVVALWMIQLTRRGCSCTKWNIWRGELLILLLLPPSKKYCKAILKFQVPPLWNCFELGEATTRNLQLELEELVAKMMVCKAKQLWNSKNDGKTYQIVNTQAWISLDVCYVVQLIELHTTISLTS